MCFTPCAVHHYVQLWYFQQKNTDLVKSCIKGYKKSQSGPSAYKILHLSNLICVYTYDNIAIKLLCLAVYFHDLEAEDNGFFLFYSLSSHEDIYSHYKKKSPVGGVRKRKGTSTAQLLN